MYILHHLYWGFGFGFFRFGGEFSFELDYFFGEGFFEGFGVVYAVLDFVGVGLGFEPGDFFAVVVEVYVGYSGAVWEVFEAFEGFFEGFEVGFWFDFEDEDWYGHEGSGVVFAPVFAGDFGNVEVFEGFLD